MVPGSAPAILRVSWLHGSPVLAESIEQLYGANGRHLDTILGPPTSFHTRTAPRSECARTWPAYGGRRPGQGVARDFSDRRRRHRTECARCRLHRLLAVLPWYERSDLGPTPVHRRLRTLLALSARKGTRHGRAIKGFLVAPLGPFADASPCECKAKETPRGVSEAGPSGSPLVYRGFPGGCPPPPGGVAVVWSPRPLRTLMAYIALPGRSGHVARPADSSPAAHVARAGPRRGGAVARLGVAIASEPATRPAAAKRFSSLKRAYTEATSVTLDLTPRPNGWRAARRRPRPGRRLRVILPRDQL